MKHTGISARLYSRSVAARGDGGHWNHRNGGMLSCWYKTPLSILFVLLVTIMRCHGWVMLCKTKPIRGAAGDGASGTQGVDGVQTNPIGRQQTGKTIAKAGGLDAATRHPAHNAKQSQFPGPGPRPSESCETKPIRRDRWANDAKQTQFPAVGRGRGGRNVQNEPNWVGTNAQNEANSETPGCDPGVDSAKRSQFRQRGRSVAGRVGHAPPPGTIVQNKASSSVADSGQRCDGTHLRASGPGAVVQTNPIGRRQLCKTNPIRPGRAGWVQACGTKTEECCTNKPNCRRHADPEIGVPGSRRRD